jgi:hypothetical protein
MQVNASDQKGTGDVEERFVKGGSIRGALEYSAPTLN